MSFFLYTIVGSIFVALGDNFLQYVQYTIPRISIAVKLTSTFFILFFIQDLIINNSYLQLGITLMGSFLVSYLRILVKNRKVNPLLDDQKILTLIYVFVSLMFFTLAFLVLRIFHNLDFYHNIYTLAVILLSLYGLRKEKLSVRYQGTVKDTLILTGPLIMEFLLTCYAIVSPECALFTILATELYQVYLLGVFCKQVEIKTPGNMYPVLFMVALILLKTFLLYLEYTFNLDMISFVFGYAGDVLAFWMIYFVLHSKDQRNQREILGLAVPRAQYKLNI